MQNVYLSAYKDLKVNSPVNKYQHAGMKASKGAGRKLRPWSIDLENLTVA